MELLASIVEAHGGFDRWRRFNRVVATIVTGGTLWGMKNLTQDQDPRRMSVSLHEEVSSVAPFGDPDWHTEFTPERVAILRGDGTVVAERRDPRASFAGHEMTTPWDPLHRAYSTSATSVSPDARGQRASRTPLSCHGSVGTPGGRA